MAPVIVFLVFAIPAVVIIALAGLSHRERIEAIKNGHSDYFIKMYNAPKTGNAALFWGLVFVALGLALGISAVGVMRHFDHDTFTGGLLCLFAGMGMVAYWRITAPDREKIRRLYDIQMQKYLAELENARGTADGGGNRAETAHTPSAENE